MSDGARIPVTRLRLRAQDEDEAAGFIEQMYVGQRPRLQPLRGEQPRYGIDSVGAGPLRADRVQSSFRFRTGLDAFDAFTFYYIVRGSITVDDGMTERHFGPGAAGMYRYGAGGYDISTDKFTSASITVPFDAVAEAAADGGSESDPRRLRFTSLAPRSPAAQRSWLALLDRTYREVMSAGATAVNALQNQQLVRAVASAALTTFPNTTMTTDYLPGPGQVESAAVRRAIAYIDDNAHRPITLGQIAAASGIGVRALQYAFRQHRGTTPMHYLRQARLDRAHHDLRAADPAQGETVAAIAARWGFAKPSRFAAYYRQTYHQPPNHTLHT